MQEESKSLVEGMGQMVPGIDTAVKGNTVCSRENDSPFFKD